MKRIVFIKAKHTKKTQGILRVQSPLKAAKRPRPN